MTTDSTPLPAPASAAKPRLAALPAVTWADPERRRAFEQWLAALTTQRPDPASVRPASADASFRRYLRLDTMQGPRIVMDAPTTHEDSHPFVRLAARLRAAGLNAPEVLAWQEADGFLLLSDLGETTYLAALDGAASDQTRALYTDATTALLRLQGIADADVPDYDRALLARELALFPEWYVERHLGTTLNAGEHAQLHVCFELILANSLAQPRCLVHRDYHSRNLMHCGAADALEVAQAARPPEHGSDAATGSLPLTNPGILDFQDAVHGPITYDLVSLLRDAYIDLDEEVQIDHAVRYWERARRAGLPVSADFGSFWRDFEWMGLQRHLKVLGIFARLAHRDGKPGYLQDMPRVWSQAHRVATRYNGLTPLAHLLERLAGIVRESGHTF